jgi:hypothetical protein
MIDSVTRISDGTWYRITTDDGWRTQRGEVTQDPELQGQIVISDRDWNALQTLRYPKDAEGRYLAEVTQDPEELPDDQIVPDNTDPLPPEPEVKTDPVDDE